MRIHVLNAFAAALFVVPAGVATEQLILQPQSKLWVEGTSTLKSFSCKVPEFTLAVKADNAGAVPAVLAGQKAVRSVDLSVPTAKIECGSGTMNEHMRKALKADANETIKFTLSDYDVAGKTAGAEGTMRGSLSLGGAERPVAVTAVATDAGDGAMRVVGSYELALSAYDLKAPSLMMGSIKVGDKVRVRFDLVLKN